MNRSIEILIGPDGTLTIDAVNFRGADCDQATAFLEQALGLTGEKRRKLEFYQTQRRQREQQVGA